jgi:hypothetical protein
MDSLECKIMLIVGREEEMTRRCPFTTQIDIHYNNVKL